MSDNVIINKTSNVGPSTVFFDREEVINKQSYYEDCAKCGTKILYRETWQSPTFYKSSGKNYKKGDPRLDENGNHALENRFISYKSFVYEELYCNDCQEIANDEKRKKQDEEYEKAMNESFFSKDENTRDLTRVISVKQHANGFRVETDNGIIHAFPPGRYCYKVCKYKIDHELSQLSRLIPGLPRKVKR